MGQAMRINELTHRIIGAAIEVHKHLDPGLLESAYETCLVFELEQRGLSVERQKPVPIIYKEIKLDHGYRIDLFVNNSVILELKSVDQILPVHEAQILSYMRFAQCKTGLLFNFNVLLLKAGGIHRFVL